MSKSTLAILCIALAGCSLIYNPNNLPSALETDADVPDASIPDAELPLDADPSMLVLERVTPSIVVEGAGDGGSRSAVLVIHGHHLVPGATVAITAHTAGELPMVTVDNAKLEVAANGNLLAVPIAVPVDPALGATESFRLDITVTQPSPAGPVSRTLSAIDTDSPVLTLRGLDELTSGAALPTSVAHTYSQIAIASGTISAADNSAPLVLRSTSSISITNGISVSANGLNPGPGGGAGGNGGSGVVGAPGLPGSGPGGGITSGGGGGFQNQGGDGAVAGTGGSMAGDASLTTLALPNRSSGGAGGNGGLLGALGGKGGGGGGSIELSASGDLALGTVDARGGNGTTAAGTRGGGGSGGVVLLRAGGAFMAGDVNASGGTGAGAGSPGRVRFDAGEALASLSSTPASYRGPMWSTATPLIVRSDRPSLTVTGQTLSAFNYYIVDDSGMNIEGPLPKTIAANPNTFTLERSLFHGLNKLCLLVEGASIQAQRAEAQNCIELAYLP